MAVATMPTTYTGFLNKMEKKTKTITLLWLDTALHQLSTITKKGLVQNNAMIECQGPQTSSTPIVHVRTAQ